MGVPIPLKDFEDDFDPFTGLLTAGGEGHIVEVHDELAKLRRRASVHELDLSTHFGAPKYLFIGDTPVYAVLGYKEVDEILTDVDRFSNKIYERSLGITFGRSVTVMDPPEHTRYRKLFQAAFTPKMLDSLRGKFQAVVDRLMAKFIDRGEADLVKEFALHFPFQFIMDLMDMPEEQRPLFHKIAIAQTCMMFDMEHSLEASRRLGEYLDQLINDRRENGAEDDFVAVMARAEIEGERLPQIVLISFFRQLMNAGGDTSYHGFSNILTALFTHPDQLTAVKQDRELIRPAIEEGLRWNGPLLAIQREPKADVVIGGVEIPKGAYINVCIGAANRDESVWEDPDSFNIFRPVKRHFAFGFGAHVCIGQHLARMELTIALNDILNRLPNVRLNPDKVPPVIHGLSMRGPESVHVKFG